MKLSEAILEGSKDTEQLVGAFLRGEAPTNHNVAIKKSDIGWMLKHVDEGSVYKTIYSMPPYNVAISPRAHYLVVVFNPGPDTNADYLAPIDELGSFTAAKVAELILSDMKGSTKVCFPALKKWAGTPHWDYGNPYHCKKCEGHKKRLSKICGQIVNLNVVAKALWHLQGKEVRVLATENETHKCKNILIASWDWDWIVAISGYNAQKDETIHGISEFPLPKEV